MSHRYSQIIYAQWLKYLAEQNTWSKKVSEIEILGSCVTGQSNYFFGDAARPNQMSI